MGQSSLAENSRPLELVGLGRERSQSVSSNPGGRNRLHTKTRSAAQDKGLDRILRSCGPAATANDGFCSRMRPALVGRVGGSRHEKGLARKRRIGGANRKPRARSRLARPGTNLLRGCTPARRVQLVDRLLLGRQSGRSLGATPLYSRQLSGG